MAELRRRGPHSIIWHAIGGQEVTQVRPQRHYREQFRRLILAEEPGSVLDVGCGGGTMLRWLAKAGIPAEGLEPDIALVERLRGEGHVVHHGRGEELPVDDGSFDVVASEYCAHHFADLRAHLAEAQRVARKAVLLLDPWYDVCLESQCRMLRWDNWWKRIDRREGKVHNEVLSIADFLAAMPEVAVDRIGSRHWLDLAQVDLDWFDEENATYAASASADDIADLATIRADFVTHGMTDDGAIVVRIVSR